MTIATIILPVHITSKTMVCDLHDSFPNFSDTNIQIEFGLVVVRVYQSILYWDSIYCSC